MTQNHSENTRRIARNTLFLYGRMLLGMIVSLYTSRLVLQALGVDDYGIINVVGGLVTMFALISNSLTAAISRFMTFELGTGNKERLGKVFATSMLIQISLSAIILTIGETLGLWFLNTQMNIPADRMFAANCVFQTSILSFILGLLSCPYNAAIMAHERMNVYAYIGLLDIGLKLAIVLFIAFSPLTFDRLIVYAALLCAVGLILQIIYVTYCRRNFEESRARLRFDKSLWKEMGGFAGWNAIGCSAGLLKDQGVNILLNIFFGPVINAARGIAVTVSNAICGFSANFMAAVNPQITKSYAAQDKKYTFSLVERGSRFSYYIMMMLAIPVIIDTEYILTLWLKTYPEYSVIFVRLVLITALIEILSNTLITLQVSTGKIRNYQIAVGGMLLMNFPLSYIFLKFGFPPTCVYIISIGVGTACLFLRLLFLQNMVGLSMRNYFINVIFNVLKVSFFATIIPAAIYPIANDGFIRLAIIVVSSALSSALAILYIGCNINERKFIISKIAGFRKRLIRC